MAWEGNKTNVQSLAVIHNDNVNTTGTTPLQIKQDSTGDILSATYGANGAGFALKMKEVAITLNTSGTVTTSNNFFPANAVPYALSILVTTQIDDGAKFIKKIGNGGADDMIAGGPPGSGIADNVLEQQNDVLTFAINAGDAVFSGDSGIGAAQNLVITCDGTPSAGAIRATLWYWQLSVDTSA